MPGKLCEQCGISMDASALRCPGCGQFVVALSGDDAVVEIAREVQAVLGDQYRVERPIGRGGAALVLAVQDLQLSRALALKILSPDVADRSETALRFRREAETAARLGHPNIVQIYFVGEAADLPFYVMPLVDGEPLSARIRREGAMPPDAAGGIVRDIAAALDFAHGQGVIHRDVKPDNILLDSLTGRSLLMDFGIAKALTGETAITGAGYVVGTPRYVSPEQASGEGTVDARTDIYSLGVVTFEMLSGDAPFDGDTPQSLFAQHMMSDIPSISERNPGLPAAVEAVITRVLAKSPGQRFATAGEFAAALLGALGGRQVRPSGDTVIPRQRRSDVQQFRTLEVEAVRGAPEALDEPGNPLEAQERAEWLEGKIRRDIDQGRWADVAVGLEVLLERADDRRPPYRQPNTRALMLLSEHPALLELLTTGWLAGDAEAQARIESVLSRMERLQESLVEIAVRERRGALLVLCDRIGSLTDDVVAQLARDTQVTVVRAFLDAVRESTRPADVVQRWLLLTLRHPRPEARVLTLRVAGERGGPLAERLGRLGLADREPAVRMMALRTMGRSGRRDVVPALAQRLETGSPDEQTAAAAALGDLGYAEAVPALARVFKRRKLMRVERGPVQEEAARALSRIHDPRAAAALAALTGDPHGTVRRIAREATK